MLEAVLNDSYYEVAGFFTLTIGGQQPLTITTTSLTNAIHGQPYNAVLSATGGSGTGYTWSLPSGALPTGFTLTPAGVISSIGSPSAMPQTYTFTAKVTDSAGNTATRTVNLIVSGTYVWTVTGTQTTYNAAGNPNPPIGTISGTVTTSDQCNPLAANGCAILGLNITDTAFGKVNNASSLSSCSGYGDTNCWTGSLSVIYVSGAYALGFGCYLPLYEQVSPYSLCFGAIGTTPATSGQISYFVYSSSIQPSENVSPELAIGTYTLTPPEGLQAPASVPGKSLGDPNGRPGGCSCGNPIDVGSGNKYQTAADYTSTGSNKLDFSRYYNSLSGSGTFATYLGTNWRSDFDRYLHVVPTNGTLSNVTAERANGQFLTFTGNGGNWVADSDIDAQLIQTGSATWRLTDYDDTVETYTVDATGKGILNSIRKRDGYSQQLAYNANGQLASVTDTYNRTLSLTYSGSLLQTVATPDGLILTYGYSAVSGGSRLTSVSYSTNPATSQTYLYENSSFPFALTGIIDENGNRYATWTYDSLGRGLTSEHAGGADLTTISYDDTTGNRTVTNALGQQLVYKFTTLQNVPKVTEIDRLATSTTAAASEMFTYDSNGYTASVTDWNGNQTAYLNDAHGQPTTINEAVGTPAARTTTITYDSTFVHLPKQIVTPGLTTSFTYDSSGDVLTKTLIDTTSATVPYATGGQTRTWTYTWSNSLLASVQGPRTDVKELTQFTYDGTGALTATTNALNQTTKIMAHLPGGLPRTIVDPNGVTANLTYDTRNRLLSRAVTTAAGVLSTGYAYDAAGNLLTTTLPDGSALTNSYDAAHRLTGVSDLFKQSMAYMLDALGDRTQINVLDAAGKRQREHSTTFDPLGRVLQDIGGVSQTTTFTYDANGNPLKVTDPLQHATVQAFDALNRPVKTTDAAAGVTTISYL